MKKAIIILLIITVGGFFLWTGYLWKFFSCSIAGSDPCVQTWTLNTSESNLIKVIEAVKKEHPELNPPYEHYATPEKRRYWYDFKFHYPDTNEDLQTWIRGTDQSNYTIIALVALYSHIDSLTPISKIDHSLRKEINRDYNYFENKKQISKFEEKIVTLLQEKIKTQKAIKQN